MERHYSLHLLILDEISSTPLERPEAAFLLEIVAKRCDRGKPMTADGAGNLGRVYGVSDEDAGVDIRGRFLIDPDGVIEAAEILHPPVGRNVEEILTGTLPEP